MIQKYILTIEGKNLPDLSKDIAQELDCAFLMDKPSKINKINVEKDVI